MTPFAAVLDRSCGRCIFRNECLQAHLLGLRLADGPVAGRFAGALTLVVAYGEADARVEGSFCRLREGQRLSIEPGCDFELRTEAEADLLVIFEQEAPSWSG